MNLLFNVYRLLIITSCFLFSSGSMGATYNLKLGDYNSSSPYMRDLIKKALEADGHTVNITVLAKKHKIRRIIKLVAQGELAIFWAGKGRQFTEKPQLLTIDIGLTLGLKAKQVMFINKDSQSDYDNISTLDQFRALRKKGVFGSGWAATEFWKYNNLDFISIDGGSTVAITKMSIKGNRGFDYFSRGVLAAAKIYKNNPGLELEQNLLLEFDDDFIIYLNHDKHQLHKDLQSALQKAVAGDLVRNLLRKHFPDTFDENGLNFDKRISITLQRPQ